MVNDMVWSVIEGNWVEARHKLYGDGPDVIVSIHESPSGFEVRSSAASRTSGPSDAVVGTFATIEEARDGMKKECEDWDQYIASFG